MDEFDTIMAEFEETMDEFDAAYEGYETAMADVAELLGDGEETQASLTAAAGAAERPSAAD